MVRNKRYNRNKGAVLFVVLMVIAAIVTVGLGFIVRGDMELAVGQNVELKADMDYIAESGIEHAKGLILNPQDTSGDFWTGAARQQLVSGSDDYYDIDIVQLSAFNYQLTSTGYREIAGQEKAKSSLTAQLRLNPCVAYWQTKEQSIPSLVSIIGDAYFGDKVVNYGNIYGDVYSVKTITNALFGQIQGQLYPNATQAPINPPGIEAADFSSVYYIGSDVYSVGQLVPGDYYTALTLSPNGSNPAGVYYC
ncbi:MAG: hypothetical protein PHQ00_04045, partial [Phycisphaerae bacterium]|nr:hypothetical protein [Phycisphaerae bacterium]